MIRFLAFASLLLMSTGVLAQNHLVNSGFDADLAGWTVSGAVLPLWDERDVAGSPGSGSALLKNVEAVEFSDVVALSQCLVQGKGGYLWNAWFYIPSGQSRTGSAVIRYFYHPFTTDCTGNAAASGGHLITGPFNQWNQLVGNQINALSSNGGSIQYIIAIRKTEADGEFTAYVDDTLLFREFLLKSSFE